MAKQQKSKKRRPPGKADEVDPVTGEDRRAEATTVAWMLTMFATTMADVLALVTGVAMPLLAADAEEPGLALVLPRLLLWVAVLSGLTCLALTPLVYKFRREPPPLPITLFGIVACFAPVVALCWQTLG